MQRRIESEQRAELWIERLAWNAAAGAVLTVMILVLLGSLRWLDHVAPRAVGAVGSPPPRVTAGPARPDPAIAVSRPSG